ncbi:hypothetical protein AALP_AA8G250100 [Arabis alpina]|uniref:Uncharacterized protein n=1 Tax=Arabis alpina TaxID=50452 RepID=A0A087G999_ARAAL|nr:hypothetical protein AALP_AA8G250100 [Arabis alpina]
MLLILETPAGFTRRTISPIGDDIVQSRRRQCSNGFLPPSTGLVSQVRRLSLNDITPIHRVLIESPTSSSPLPEPPDLLPLEPREPSPPPKPPYPPDPPLKSPSSEFNNLPRFSLSSLSKSVRHQIWFPFEIPKVGYAT